MKFINTFFLTTNKLYLFIFCFIAPLTEVHRSIKILVNLSSGCFVFRKVENAFENKLVYGGKLQIADVCFLPSTMKNAQ